MSRTIHLVRHGEVHNPDHVVYASLPGFGLSDRGRAESTQLARYLRSGPITAIWSSPLERAVTTAEPLAAALGLPIRVHEDLTEWRQADDWAGIRWEDLPRERPGQLEAYLEHPTDMPSASETLAELAKRMSTVIRRLAQQGDGDLVVVSHQDPVQAARLALTGRDLTRQHHDKPGHGTVISLAPGTPWRELAIWHPPASEEPDPVSAAHPVAEPEQLGIGLEGEVGEG